MPGLVSATAAKSRATVFQYMNVRACRRLKSLSRPPRLRGNQTFSHERNTRATDPRSSRYEPLNDRPERVTISVGRKVLLIDPARGRQLPACAGQMTSGIGPAQ